MKRTFFLFFGIIAILSLSLSSCIKDSCNSTQIYRLYTPIYKQMSEVRQMIEVSEPREMISPGKIYAYGKYLFINDRGVGIHITDISNQTNPTQVAFLKIPGNVDMAVKGTYLYADNFVDLVVFDLSDMNNIKQIGREENVFPDNVSVHERAGYWLVDREQGVAIDWLVEDVEVECDAKGGWSDDVLMAEQRDFSGSNESTSELGGGSNGAGGSMARFTFMSGYLYVIDKSGSMRLFDVSSPENPQLFNSISISSNIETIFPYYRDQEQYLFIGATNGMSIWDNNQPQNPTQIAEFVHVNSCDPVVADDSLAFVTLRSGTECEGFTNELQLINIKDLENPLLLETYDMHNPHGLGFDSGILFICDAEEGVKIYDLRESYDNVSKKLLAHIEGMFAYDVIPYNGTLILTSDKGFHLIDYTDVNNIRIVGEILTVAK